MRVRFLFAVATLLTFGACTASVVQGAAPRCSEGAEVEDELVLEAQSVPSAELVPCITEVPANWSVTVFHVRDGETIIELRSHSEAGGSARATFTSTCNTSGATEQLSGKEGTRLFVRQSPLVNDVLIRKQFYTFPGGCVTYDFDLRGEGVGARFSEADGALDFTPRSVIENAIETETDFEL
jgi:hypothetical protein